MSRPDKRQRERARRQRRAERKAGQQAGGGGRTGSQSRAQDGNADPVRGAPATLIDETLCWHMARTIPLLGPLGRKRLDDALVAHEVQAYRPRASEVVVRRNRRVVRHVPLLIRTLIIGVRDAAHLDQVAKLPGVSEIVSCPCPDPSGQGNLTGYILRPARLEPKALQKFVIALAAGEIIRPVGIAVGDQVVVMTGPFLSFPGIVEEILSGDRVKVAVSIFGRPSPVELRIADVQRV